MILITSAPAAACSRTALTTSRTPSACRYIPTQEDAPAVVIETILPARTQPRRADEPLLRRAPQRELEVVPSADVADRREAGDKGAPRVLRHAENAQPRRVTVLNGRIGETGVRQMNVTVDQSRRDRPIRDIDPRDIGCGVDVATNGPDPVTLDEHRAGTKRRRTSAIDQRASRDEDSARVAQGEREV